MTQKNAPKKINIITICNRGMEIIIWIFFFTLPIYLNSQLSGVNIAKCLLAQILISIMLSLWLIKLLSSSTYKFITTPMDIAVLAYLLVNICATLASVNPAISFFGSYKRYEGLITHINYCLLFFIITNFISTISHVKHILRVIVSAGLIVSCYGFLQHHGIDYTYWGPAFDRNRVFASFGNPIFLGAYLVLIVPLTAMMYFIEGKETSQHLRIKSKKKSVHGQKLKEQIFLRIFWTKYLQNILPWLYGIVLTIITISLALSQNRSSYLGFMTSLFIMIGFIWWGNLLPEIKRRAIIAAICLLAVIGYYNLKPETSIMGRFLATITLSGPDEVSQNAKSTSKIEPKKEVEFTGTAASRLFMWRDCLKMLLDYPFFGIGLETMGVMYPQYRSRDLILTEGGQYGRPDRVHNDFIDFAITRGIIGFIIYLWLFGIFAWIILRRFKKQDVTTKWLIAGFFSAWVGYIVQNQFSIGIMPLTSLFWGVMAMGTVSVSPVREVVLKIRYKIPIIIFFAVMIPTLLFWTYYLYKSDIHFRQGTLAYDAGNFDAAIAHFEEAIRYHPYERVYYEHLIWAYLNKGEKDPLMLEKAIISIKEVIQTVPQDSLFYNLLGYTYQREAEVFGTDINKTKESFEAYHQAVRMDPLFSDAWENMAMLYMRNNREKEAIECFKKAVFADPYSGKCWYSIGHLYEQQNKFDKAEGAYLEAITKNLNESESIDTYNGLGRIYYSRANSARKKMLLSEEKRWLLKTTDVCEGIVAINPKDIATYKNLGSLYYKLGMWDKAEERFKKAQLLDPSDIYIAQKLYEIMQRK